MIELAPNRKQGLAIANPVIAAAGSVGYATESGDLIALDRFGAIVTPPISLRPRRGSPPSRLIEVPGGILLNHGDQNPGWNRLLERFGDVWSRSKVPMIAHVIGHTSLGELARRIEGAGSLAGLEYDVESEEALSWLAGLRAAVELPILSRVPYGGATLAAQAVEAGADAVVCIMPPGGAAMDWQNGQMLEGSLYGPSVKALALKTLRDVLATGLNAPVIACGGVHAQEDMSELLAAGACAVMLDSLAWVESQAVNTFLSLGF